VKYVHFRFPLTTSVGQTTIEQFYMLESKESMEFTDVFTVDRVICAVGLVLLARWLLTTSLGRKALVDSPPRRNYMPVYAPFFPLLIWFGPVPLASMLARQLWPDLKPWQGVVLDNGIFCLGALVTAIVIVGMARFYFEQGLTGFGLGLKRLRLRRIVRDFGAGAVNLLAVWPLVMAAMVLTIVIVELVSQRQYKIARHEELNLILEYPQWPLRLVIAFVAIVVAPILEEMLFRGLFQTAIRTFLETWLGTRHSGLVDREPNPDAQSVSEASQIPSDEPRVTSLEPPATTHTGRIWLAIFLSSAFFALMHANPGHWPSLFILGTCMGYAYEKSGSLIRAMFIHAIFNAVTVAATLSQ
jgi:membrane protease YdiL (CAAX protease family)